MKLFAIRLTTILRKGLLLAAIVLTGTVHAAIPPAEQLLPADTLYVITSPDCVKTRELFKKSLPGMLLNDPAMKPFREKFIAKWKEEFVEPLERDLGVKLDNYADLLQGQFTMAVTQDGWNGREDRSPAVVILLDAKGKSGQLKSSIAELRKKWVDSGKNLRTEKMRDIEFSIVSLSSNDIPSTLRTFFPKFQEVHEIGDKKDEKSSPKTELVIGQFESLLIVSSSPRAADKIAARLTGGSLPALADEASFDASRTTLFRDAPVFAWLNAKRLFDVMSSLPADEPNPEAPTPLPRLPIKETLNALGISGLKSVSLTCRQLDDGALIELFLGVPEANRTGFFKILSPDAKDSSPPAFVPADVVMFHRWRIDGQKALAATEKAIGEFSPETLRIWDFLLETAENGMKDKDPSYKIRKNFFGNLGDDFISYEKAGPAPAEGEPRTTISIFLVGSPNAEQMAAAFAGPLSLLSRQASNPETREFRGKKIYSVPSVRPPLVGSAFVKAKTLYYTASGGYLAVSSDISMLEEFLRSSEGQAKSLRENQAIIEAAQKVGGLNTGSFGFENQAENMRATFESVKNTKPDTGMSTSIDLLTTAGNIPFANPEKSLKAWMDFSLLPPFDSVSKYFGISVSSCVANGEGLSYKFYFPTSAELKK